jgi:acylphosphatase
MSRSIVRVTVRGLVQGVGYRAFVERRAHEHEVEGWVRNRRDGSVEAAFAGPDEEVEAMVEACRRGPRHGRVDALETEEAGPDLLAERIPGERFSVLSTV